VIAIFADTESKISEFKDSLSSKITNMVKIEHVCNTTQAPPGRKKKITSCRRAISHNSFIHFKIIDKKNKNVV